MSEDVMAAREITGALLVAGRERRGGGEPFRAIDPRTGRPLDPEVHEATESEVAEAAAEAGRAFDEWQAVPGAERARLLDAIAATLEASRDAIVAVADAETALGSERLTQELARTCAQLRLYAAVVAEGSYVEAVISPADPAARPAPRPDLRRMLVPMGPVAVFTPSNFPLAFGVAGTDTASALAAGCPVIVKGHPSHPATSEICGRAVARAVRDTGAPPGVFSLLQARSPAIARALVQAPEIAAVAFTGSYAAGRALHDAAAARPRPIPVYAEMGSLNPVFVGPTALARRGEAIADGLAGSVTQGVGQFCTKPGLVFAPGDEGRAFAERLAALVAARPAGVMLNAALRSAFARAVERTLALAGVERLAPVQTAASGSAVAAVVAMTTARVFEATPALREEHFGPFTLVVRCADPDEAIAIARRLDGQLAAAIHADPEDTAWAARLAGVLAHRVGRIVWNGYPTGVAVAWATHHGGPFPATTWSAHTSVGPLALRRFLRPVAYQNVPEALLPAALRDGNPLGLQRLVEGQWTRSG